MRRATVQWLCFGRRTVWLASVWLASVWLASVWLASAGRLVSAIWLALCGLGLSGGLLGCVPEERTLDHQVPTEAASVVASVGARPQKFRTVPRPRPSTTAPGGSSPTVAPLVRPFQDDFERGRLGRNYRATGHGWQVQSGRLCGTAVKNHPVWLLRRLPSRVRIEFGATSESDDGDIKAEVFGDGQSFARGESYSDATSYLLIYGGWKNSRHVLARLDEHSPDRLERLVRVRDVAPGAQPVERGRTYRFKVERSDGRRLTWWVDGEIIHNLTDSVPLRGPGHEYFAFNGWRARVCFDNLKLVPLGS